MRASSSISGTQEIRGQAKIFQKKKGKIRTRSDSLESDEEVDSGGGEKVGLGELGSVDSLVNGSQTSYVVKLQKEKETIVSQSFHECPETSLREENQEGEHLQDR